MNKSLLEKLQDEKYRESIKTVYMEHEGNLFYAVCISKDSGVKEREVIYDATENTHNIDKIEEEMKNWNIYENDPAKSIFNFIMRPTHISLYID